MNPTNRSVDILLNTETVKPLQPIQRANGRENDVTALKQKENSFDDVYRQQRRDEAEVRQKERASQRQQSSERTSATTEKRSVDGNALPPERTAKTTKADAEESVVEESGFDSQFVDGAEKKQNTEVSVHFDTLLAKEEGVDESEQLELGLVDGEESVETEAQVNLQAQPTIQPNSDAEAGSRASQTAASVPDILKELRQGRLGEVADGTLKADLNNGSQAKPVAGSLAEQGSSNQLQDRFAHIPLGQDMKLLREQFNVGAQATGAAKVGAAEAAKNADGDGLARLNTLAQAAQTLGQTRPGTVTASVQAPVGSTDWSQAVAQRIVWLANRGISAAELQLNPRELGPVDVRINMSGEQTTVQFSSQQAAVREALESSVVRLREMLESSGLNLADVDVSDQSQSEQAQADGREAGTAGSSDEHDELDNVSQTQTVQRLETDSLIDLHA